jgi:hypothetical protein
MFVTCQGVTPDRGWAWALVTMLPVNWLTYPYLPWVPWKPWRLSFDSLPGPHILGAAPTKDKAPHSAFLSLAGAKSFPDTTHFPLYQPTTATDSCISGSRKRRVERGGWRVRVRGE